jgi:hypothetical protein
MSDFDNTNRGVLFRNDKGDNPKRPDYTGKLNVAGAEFKLSAWLKESAKGKFLSISVQPVEAQTAAPKPTPKANPVADPAFDDEIPF